MSKAAKVQYNHLNFRLAEWAEQETIIAFVNEHFDWNLPLINHRPFFEYYYCGKRLQFALAEQDGTLVAVAGYILANESDTPDLWVSVWVARKGATGAGLELMNAIPSLTGARVVACNNIRENTCVFYRFLGWTAERLPHYYRLSSAASHGVYALYRPTKDDTKQIIQAVSTQLSTLQEGKLPLQKVQTADELVALGMPALPKGSVQTPAKDIHYLQRRYFAYPGLEYDVFQVTENGVLLAYCVTRTVQSTLPEQPQKSIPVVRMVDFIGDATVLPRIGAALDAWMEAQHAEYMDCYCAGIDAAYFTKAGFCERTTDSDVIVPNYLTPALIANTDYFYFTNNPNGFTMFKADGDQDRPNLF